MLKNSVAFTATDDFTEASGTFTFSNADSTECVTIDIVDDSTSEPSDKCFALELSDGTETIDSPNLATVCITDDDGQPQTTQTTLFISHLSNSFTMLLT